MQRTNTGIKKLDSLLGGGFPKNASVLISGGPGSGKTLFALNFLMEGARKGEKCCYLSLNESREELLRACEGIESLKDVKKHIGRNLAIEHIKLGEKITPKQFSEIMKRYPDIDRLVIDNVNKLLMFSENPKAYRKRLSAMLSDLKRIGSTLILCETESDSIDSGNNEAFETDGVITLSFIDIEEKPIRILSIHKMRYTAIEPKVPHELLITGKAIDLTETRII